MKKFGMRAVELALAWIDIPPDPEVIIAGGWLCSSNPFGKFR
jgi:hypothetical protein